MRVTSVEKPLWEILYQTAGSGGLVQIASLSIIPAKVDQLPLGVTAMLACSDLQGRELPRSDGRPLRLLGEALAHEVAFLSEVGEIPAMHEIGVLLLGDFYAGQDVLERGQHGDVQPVWRAFDRFRWVVGVAGNHDEIDGWSGCGLAAGHLLDGDIVVVDGLRIGGVSGIIGDTKKGRPWRRGETDFVKAVRHVLRADPHVLLLHQGPEVSEAGLLGHGVIRMALESAPNLLTVCGHVHWSTPLAVLPSGGQVLNVDARAILLHQ